MAEQQDASVYANQIFAQVSHEHTDTTDLGLYLARVVAALFEMSPDLREHISDFLIAELVEELSRRGEEEAMRAVLRVQRDWMQGP